MNSFCILGATGTTGKTIAQLLDAESMNLTLASKSRDKLEKLNEGLKAKHRISTFDVESYPEILSTISNSNVVINCIGPFTVYGEKVIEACLEAKADYLDITGEQHFIKTVQTRFHDRAREACVALVPSSAFEFAIADAAIALLGAELGKLDNVEVTYKFKNISTSRGTNRSVIQALSSPAYFLIDEELKEIKGQVESYKDGKINTRFAFPGGEVFLAPQHTDVKTVKTYLTSPVAKPILSLVSRLMPAIVKSTEPVLSSIAGRSNQAIAEDLQAKTSFSIELVAKRDTDAKMLSITGMNPYRLSAAIAKNIAKELANNQNLEGVLSPSMVPDYKLIVDTTKQYGAQWSR